MLNEVARVLRPNGLFLSGEWERCPTFADPSLRNSNSIPATSHLFNLIDDAMFTSHGVIPIASHIPSWLAESGHFRDITSQKYAVPIGDWHPEPSMQALGNALRHALQLSTNGLKLILKEPKLGLEEAQIDELVMGYVQEMYHVSGMVAVYHTVHARSI